MEVHRSREGIAVKKLGLMLCGCSGPCRPTFPSRNRPNPASSSKQITITTSIFFSVLGRPKRARLVAARIPRGPGIFHGAATGLFSGCPKQCSTLGLQRYILTYTKATHTSHTIFSGSSNRGFQLGHNAGNMSGFSFGVPRDDN